MNDRKIKKIKNWTYCAWMAIFCRSLFDRTLCAISLWRVTKKKTVKWNKVETMMMMMKNKTQNMWCEERRGRIFENIFLVCSRILNLNIRPDRMSSFPILWIDSIVFIYTFGAEKFSSMLKTIFTIFHPLYRSQTRWPKP